MDDNLNDLEVGITSNIPRHLNKKMRKRKHLDALLKFRSTKNNSNDVLRSSEDELFLPNQKSSTNKFGSSPYRYCWNYSKHILSFGLVSIFMIVCISLTYTNVQLKNEVQNLSSRINEIEKKFSNMELNNISSTIDQIKIRLRFLLRNNATQQLNNLNQKELENKINENIIEWDNQLNSFRNEIQNLNQTAKIQELKIYLEQLTNLIHTSSDKTSVILTEFQSDLDKLRNKIDECKCSKESIHLKPSIVNSDKLQQSTVTKPNIEKLDKQTENITDVEQIVNQPSVTG